MDGSFRKTNLLRNIRSIYLSIRGQHIETFGEDNLSSDDIFDGVQLKLMAIVEDCEDVHNDDLVYGVTIVMVDAFMRCKILERPA